MPANIQSTIILGNIGNITRTEGLALMNDILFLSTAVLGSGDLNSTLILGNDANGQDALNFNDISLNGSLYDDAGLGFGIVSAGDFTINTGGAFTWTFNDPFTFIGGNIDMSGIAGNLIVGGLGLKTDNIADNGGALLIASTNGTLTIRAEGGDSVDIDDNGEGGGIDFSSTTGDILFPSGKINGAGWFTDNITDNGSDMIIDQTFSSGILTIKSLDNNIRLLSGLAVVITTASNGDLALTVNGSGVITMNGADTFTGTLVAAGGKSFVNGLMMD